MICDIGDAVNLTATFTDPETGEPVEPDEVTCTVLSPAGDTSTPVVTGSKGIYTAQVIPDVSGKWHYAFDGEGANQASGERRFEVRRREVPRD